MSSLLALEDVHVTYNHAIVALHGVTFAVPAGEIVALLGANGAGKSTTLKAISHLLPAQRGQVTHGRILFDGHEITRRDAHAIVRDGLVQVLEGRHCFRALSIEENLLTGAAAVHATRTATRNDLTRVYEIFPRLAEKRRLAAGLASGGEQQMVAIGRALMSRPRLLLLDEPSMGLAPRTVQQIFTTLRALNATDGLTILVAEQNSTVALRSAHRAHVLEQGIVSLSDSADILRNRNDIHQFYLGFGTDAREPADATTGGV